MTRDEVQQALEQARSTIYPGAEMHTSLRQVLHAQLMLLQYIAERVDAVAETVQPEQGFKRDG